jgi:CRP-like cAMP-binding protein
MHDSDNRIPLFADLPPGSFAKIIADLREEQYPPGTVICHEGDEARDFYIIKSGEAEVLVNRGWNQRELVAVNGPNDWFGERALFSDRPRSATVVARTEVTVWRLTKEKFAGLIEENPRLILHFTQVLSDRLYQANHELSKKQAALNLQTEAFFSVLSRAQQELLMHTAILTTLDLPIMRHLLDRTRAPVTWPSLWDQGEGILAQPGTAPRLDLRPHLCASDSRGPALLVAARAAALDRFVSASTYPFVSEPAAAAIRPPRAVEAGCIASVCETGVRRRGTRHIP